MSEGVYWVELGPRERDLETARCWQARLAFDDRTDSITLYAVHRGYNMDQNYELGRFNMAWSLLYHHLRFVRGMSHFDVKVSLKSHVEAICKFANQFLLPIGFQLHTSIAVVDVWLAANWGLLIRERTPLVRPDWLDETVLNCETDEVSSMLEEQEKARKRAKIMRRRNCPVDARHGIMDWKASIEYVGGRVRTEWVCRACGHIVRESL